MRTNSLAASIIAYDRKDKQDKLDSSAAAHLSSLNTFEEATTKTTGDDDKPTTYSAHSLERVNPFDKNKPALPTSPAPTTSAYSYRPSAYAPTSSTAAVTTAYQVIQKQPTTFSAPTSGTSFDAAAAALPNYTRPQPTPAYAAPTPSKPAYARTDTGALRRDFRSNSISAHSEYSHNKPAPASPLYATLEEQPRARPSAASPLATSQQQQQQPASVVGQSSSSSAAAYSSGPAGSNASKFGSTRSIGSFSDAELIFGGSAAAAASGGRIGNSGGGGGGSSFDRFSSSTDSSGVFRSSAASAGAGSGAAAAPSYKIYDGIQNHAFQDYEATSSGGGAALAPPREEDDDDEYDLK